MQFYHTLPVGHTVDSALVAGRADVKIDSRRVGHDWLSESISKTFPVSEEAVIIRKTIYRECENVVILNALDFLYGHSLLKLYNAQHHLDHDRHLGLVLIIPEIFEWMIPSGCSEVWVVDLPLHKLATGYRAIAEFVSAELKRFKKVFLSHAYSHPDFESVDIRQFTGVTPFSLDLFNKLLPQFTFVLRQDRWWFANRIAYWFYRISRKLRLSGCARWVLSSQQNGLVKRAIQTIRSKIPGAKVYIVGLGKIGNFSGYAHDMRVTKVDGAMEKNWCTIYSHSHVVIGVHGSNMLLPTAFAAGCVEVLPEDRYGNMVQDISVRYSDRKQLFFYRFVDQYSSPRSVAEKAIAIVRDFRSYQSSMCNNVYSASTKIVQYDDNHHRQSSVVT